ncbi:unnamed protein product, partial [Amoebophrya sp. A25]
KAGFASSLFRVVYGQNGHELPLIRFLAFPAYFLLIISRLRAISPMRLLLARHSMTTDRPTSLTSTDLPSRSPFIRFTTKQTQKTGTSPLEMVFGPELQKHDMPTVERKGHTSVAHVARCFDATGRLVKGVPYRGNPT